METMEKLAEVLNDLIMINNDRIEGYEKAARQADKVDIDLRGVFTKLADDSRKHVAELTKEVQKLGEDPADDTTSRGKVYRAWMDIKNAFSNKERTSILESCEYGEDAAQKAYEDALASDAEMDADTRQMITEQKANLNRAHKMIKEYRDAHKAVN